MTDSEKEGHSRDASPQLMPLLGNNLKGFVMMYSGQFVNEYMLHQGIYTTDKPSIHWDENITIEKYISDHKMIRDAMEVEYPREMYDNIRKCKFVPVVLKVVT